MMHAKVLDILRGRVSPPDVIVYRHVDRRDLARKIKRAEVFDFGELPLTYDDNLSHWVIPSLTKDELQFFRDGYVPVPAPLCWYQFTTDGMPSAILITDDFHCERFDLPAAGASGRIERKLGFIDDAWVHPTWDADAREYEVVGDRKYLEESLKEMGDEAFFENFKGTIPMARYLTLMINSKSTDRERVPEDPIQAAEAKARNRHPMKEFTRVTIIPQRFVDAAVAEGRGTHASPRLHWRRSHLRQFRAPSGEVYHRVVIPRHLVGRADLGTVTHTYKVKPKKS